MPLDQNGTAYNTVARYSSQYEAKIVEDMLRDFSQLQLQRNTLGSHCEEIAELIWPDQRNTFFYQNFNWPGQKKTDRQVDANGMVALSRFSAICDSLLTPRNMFWHGLAASDDNLMKDRQVRLWFELATKALFKQRYAPHANFAAQNLANYKALGAWGTHAMYVDDFDGTNYGNIRGLRYKAIPFGELFIKENHQGLIDGFIRWYRMTARQAKQRWPDRPLPGQLQVALDQKNEGIIWNFLHCVGPRMDYMKDYEPDRLDAKGKPFYSYHISIEGMALMHEGGYRSFPIACGRYEQGPGEVYGRSPAMQVLPALKTLNAEKRTFLKQGHRAADPVLLTADDGVVDMSMRPGALNKGGVTADGKELVKILPTGEIQISKEMMAEEKALIQDVFLVALFQILQETPQMTATEVIERTNEKGILLAPTVGRQQSEYLGPLIDRELDLLVMQRLLPPMPPLLREAKGEYEVVYTSPLSRAMKAQEIAGFLRTVDSVKELVNVTGDPSLLDPFNFDIAIPAIADAQAVPFSWMSTPEQIAQKRQARAKQQQLQAQIQALPAQAAMVKANAVAAKAGQGQQQQQPGGVPPEQQGAPQGP